MKNPWPTSRDRIEHILAAIDWIEKLVGQSSFANYEQDKPMQFAVQWQFVVIGEAVRLIDQDILNKYDYPWHIPRSFRNFIIHAYHGIKPERIYHAANDLVSLKHTLQTILANEF